VQTNLQVKCAKRKLGVHEFLAVAVIAQSV